MMFFGDPSKFETAGDMVRWMMGNLSIALVLLMLLLVGMSYFPKIIGFTGNCVLYSLVKGHHFLCWILRKPAKRMRNQG